MPLTDAQIRNAKPGLKPVKSKKGSKAPVEFVATCKPYKLYDTKGLYLEVDPSSGKYWRFKYKFPKEKRISLGVYPEVSLADARDLRDEKRKMVAKGIDPSAKRKAEKATRVDRAENSFEVIAREFLTKFIDPLAKSHFSLVYARFENDVLTANRRAADCRDNSTGIVEGGTENRESQSSGYRPSHIGKLWPGFSLWDLDRAL